MTFRRQHTHNSRAAIEAGTPVRSEYVHDETLNTIRVGDGAKLGGYLLKRWGMAYAVSPPQITADQNNYSPTDLVVAEGLFLASDAPRSITGLALGEAGRRIALINRGSFAITLVNASTSSTAANRFLFEDDIVLRPFASIELQYSATDSRWMRASGGNKLSFFPEELLLAGKVTPPQITANQNDYAPTGITAAVTLRLATDASRNITGIADPRPGAIKVILNVGTNPLVLKNADAGSAAANRFDFSADVTLAAKQSAIVEYDSTDNRWKLLGSTAGAAVAAGAVTAQTLAASALSASLPMVNGMIAESHAGNAVTFAIKTLAGNDPTSGDPVFFVFGASSGSYVVRTVTAALSVTISSGSSLGASSAVPFRVWLTAIDDAGTVRIGAIKCATSSAIKAPNQALPVTTTAEGGAGAADSAGVMYTGTAVSAKFFRFIGYADYNTGLVSAGAWAASPSMIVLFGPGIALPGQMLHSETGETTANTSNSTTSYADTLLTASIDLSSPVNGVAFAWDGQLLLSVAGGNAAAILRRGGSQIGQGVMLVSISSAMQVPVGKRGIEFPGAAGSQTYTVAIKSSVGGNVVLFPSPSGGAVGEGGTLQLAEIQA